MKVALWGAGAVGDALSQRLVMSPFVSELHWINRTFSKIEAQCVDLGHGFAFAPTCRRIEAYEARDARYATETADVVIVAAGKPVAGDGDRSKIYPDNRTMFRESVLDSLKDIPGVAIVISNPVDLMARLVFKEAIRDEKRVIGLGTVVETARFRAALGAWMLPRRHARDVWAYAVGTHDKHFVEVVGSVVGVGGGKIADDIIERARAETAVAAVRVRQTGAAEDDTRTVQPIAEGVMAVFTAVASDSSNILTVSVRDADDPDELFYSVPCSVGREGIVDQHRDVLPVADLKAGLDNLRATLKAADV